MRPQSSRRPGLLCLAAALLLLAAPLAPSASAEEAAPVLAARDFDLLPLNELEKKELVRDHGELARRVGVLARRAKKLRDLLAARDGMDDGSRRLTKQIAQVEADLAPLMAQVLEHVRPMGVDDRLLIHIANAPRGARRVARYAAGLVLYVQGIPQERRALFEYLLPRFEGAIIALDAQRERLAAQAAGTEETKAMRDAAVAGVDAQMRRIENRYWRVVDYVVPLEARAAIHRALPTGYQRQDDVIQFLYAPPGLEPAQATRLSALLKEIEAESSPDAAAVRRLTQALRDGGREAGRNELRAAQERLLELQRFAVTEAKKIYTEDQWTWLEAIPPRVRFADRNQTSPQVLKGVDLSPAQREQLARMRGALKGVRAEYVARTRATQRKMSDAGPDSPQMARMRMEMAAVRADGNELQRAFNGRIFLEVLTRAQSGAWVLASREP